MVIVMYGGMGYVKEYYVECYLCECMILRFVFVSL